MGQAEFLDWCAFFRVQGWPGWREDVRAAELLALLANVNRDSKKRANAYKAEEFMPDWWADRKQAPVAGNNLLAKFKALTEDDPHDTSRQSHRKT